MATMEVGLTINVIAIPNVLGRPADDQHGKRKRISSQKTGQSVIPVSATAALRHRKPNSFVDPTSQLVGIKRFKCRRTQEIGRLIPYASAGYADPFNNPPPPFRVILPSEGPPAGPQTPHLAKRQYSTHRTSRQFRP